MKTLNYDPQSCYFAVRYEAAGNTDMVWCYKIKRENLELIAPQLGKLHLANLQQRDVKDYLAVSGATKNDFYDDHSGLVYPGHVNFNRITGKVTGVSFYSEGLKNDPAVNFPARISEYKTKTNLGFFKNNEEWQHPYLKDSYRLDKTIIPFNFRENYADLSVYLDNHMAIIAVPSLQEKHSVMILKNS